MNKLAYRLILIQMLLVAVVTASWWIFSLSSHALDALLGGLIGVAAQLSAVILLRATPQKDAQRFLGRLYLAEAVKLTVTAGLFALLFITVKIDIAPVISGFGATLLAYWIGLATHKPGNRLFKR